MTKCFKTLLLLRGDAANVHPSRIVTDQLTEPFKKSVINAARAWPLYFSRIFSVNVRSFSPLESTLPIEAKNPFALICCRFVVQHAVQHTSTKTESLQQLCTTSCTACCTTCLQQILNKSK